MDEKTMRKIEDRVTETKAKSFCPPTNEAVVKAWEAFDKRVVAVYDPDTEVEIERGSRQVYGIGDTGDIIRGIELRKGSASPAEELEAWNRVSDFMGDVFPRFSNPDEDQALLIVDEWNNLMDAIANDEDEATPEIRQAAEDQKIIALGRQKGQFTGMEIYDDSVDLETISRLRKSRFFCLPTNEAVVKAWEAFARRVAEVDDPDADVKIECGSRQVYGIGWAGLLGSSPDFISGQELRMKHRAWDDEADTLQKVSDFMGDTFPRFDWPDNDKLLLTVYEWNNLIDSIADDEEEASPDVRQAAADLKIVALGRQYQDGWWQGMEVYDDTVCMDEILGLREPNNSTSVKLTYTTPAGVHVAVYPGWDGDDEIISAGGWVDGVYIRPAEVDTVDLFNRLSEEVQDELRPLAAGGDPADWNGKILEIIDPDVNPKDAELLEALWIGEEVYGGSVTVYGIEDADVIWMDEDDFKNLGLHRVASDEDDEDEDKVDFGL